MWRAMFHVSLLFTQRNQILLEPYQLPVPTTSKLGGDCRNRQQITRWLSVPLGWNPHVFILFTNTVYMQISFLRVYVLEFSQMHFSLSPSPSCNYNRCHSAGGGRGRKRKERVVIWCSYATLPLALSPLFWTPLLVNKQCLPLVSYHTISK